MSNLNFSIYMHLPETRLCPENKHFPYFYAAIFSVVCLFKEIWHLLGIFCFSFAEKQTYEHLLCWLFWTRKISTNYGSNIALTWRIPLSLNSVTTNFNSYSNTTLRHRNMVNFRRRKSNMSEVFISLRLGRSGCQRRREFGKMELLSSLRHWGIKCVLIALDIKWNNLSFKAYDMNTMFTFCVDGYFFSKLWGVYYLDVWHTISSILPSDRLWNL